jgi:hypothetical protein
VIAALSSATFIPGLIVGIVIAIALMRSATTFQQSWGRPPWAVPPWAWLLIGLVLGLIGVVLYLIAQAMTKRSVGTNPYGSAYPPPVPPPPGAQAWAPPSAYPGAEHAQTGDPNPPSTSDQAAPPPQ